MDLKIFQKGFNYSQDGQGNRLVYHLQGCNMSCPWCANPEGMKKEGVLLTDKDWLKEALCPKGAVQEGRLDRSLCKSCAEHLCLTPQYKGKGIRCSYVSLPIESVYREIKSSSPMFYDGGGVTFTGGEATLQFEPLKTLLIKLNEAGVHTAIETNGTHQRLPELFPYIDQLIVDCKHWQEDAHKRDTGISMEPVLENLWIAVAQHSQVDIRIPVIGKVNDGEEDFAQFVKLFKKLNGSNVTFELLRYHEFGKHKWEECGLPYVMTEEAHVPVEKVKHFRQMLESNGLTYKKS